MQKHTLLALTIERLVAVFAPMYYRSKQHVRFALQLMSVMALRYHPEQMNRALHMIAAH